MALVDLAAMVAEVVDGEPEPALFAPPGEEAGEGPDWDGFLPLLLDTAMPETTALLAALVPHVGDGRASRVRRELDRRGFGALPAWVAVIDRPDVNGVLEQGHALGDGENLAVGLRWPGGEEGAVIVYIDHNMGTIVKDAFTLEAGVEQVARLFEDTADPHSYQRPAEPAGARARIEDALRSWSMTVPRVTSDTWPACRPAVRWVLRLLPDGGSVPEWEEPDEAETRRMVDDFLSAPEAVGVAGDADTADLVETLLWFGQGYGICDPWRWSPVRVEILLTDWFPRKVVADVGYMAKLPEVLAGFVRFAHRRASIADDLTEETLAAIRYWTPEYVEAVADDDRDTGATAVARALLAASEPQSWSDRVAWELGGAEELALLDDEPWPDETVDWAVVPEDLHDRVGEIAGLVDGTCERLFDREYATLAHRLLSRIAQRSPHALRRRGAASGWAAGILVVLGKDNGGFSFYGGGLGFTQKAVLEDLGVKSLGQKEQTVRRAAELGAYRSERRLLHSTRRRHLMDMATWEE